MPLCTLVLLVLSPCRVRACHTACRRPRRFGNSHRICQSTAIPESCLPDLRNQSFGASIWDAGIAGCSLTQGTTTPTARLWLFLCARKLNNFPMCIALGEFTDFTVWLYCCLFFTAPRAPEAMVSASFSCCTKSRKQKRKAVWCQEKTLRPGEARPQPLTHLCPAAL